MLHLDDIRSANEVHEIVVVEPRDLYFLWLASAKLMHLDIQEQLLMDIALCSSHLPPFLRVWVVRYLPTLVVNMRLRLIPIECVMDLLQEGTHEFTCIGLLEQFKPVWVIGGIKVLEQFSPEIVRGEDGEVSFFGRLSCFYLVEEILKLKFWVSLGYLPRML